MPSCSSGFCVASTWNRLRQVVARAGDRDMLFLHRLQQRRLGARAGAVDFVGHQQLGEDRSLDETEGAPAGVAFLHHFGAGDVGRHQVGRELDALASRPITVPKRLDQLGLGQAGHADQQAMAARQQRHQRLLDHFVLTEDDLAHAGADAREQGGGRFQPFDGCALCFVDRVHVRHNSSACCARGLCCTLD